MYYKTKISLNLNGLVLFDPIVLNEFVIENSIKTSNLLSFFNQNPGLGNEAINKGVVLPVYTIEAWDYFIMVNTELKAKTNPDWKLFRTNISFPLSVKGGEVIISDIYAILEWKPDYYLNFPSKKDRIGVDENFSVPNGNYAVQIIGYRDKNNSDIENRECGYEFLLKKVDKMPKIENINIDEFNFKVDGISEDSW